MDLNTVGAALRRKLGPLPVWAWALIGGAVLYFVRSRGYFGSGTKQASALQPAQASATTPRDATTLQPGESIYDPNTGQISTAPGGGQTDATGTGSGDGGGGFDPTQAIEDLAKAIIGARTDSERTNQTTPVTHKPTALDRAKAAVKTGKLGPKNKARLEKAGYSTSQISYHLRRHTGLGKPRGTSPKPGHTQTPNKTTKTKTTTTKAPPRSGSTVRHPTGRSKVRAGKSTVPVRARGTAAVGESTTRQRPRVPLVTRATAVHHPVSTAHKTATQKKAEAHAAKPTTHPASSPPTRSTRVTAPSTRVVPPSQKRPPAKKRGK